jgi:hypothetical protein
MVSSNHQAFLVGLFHYTFLNLVSPHLLDPPPAYMGVTNLCGDQFESHVANVARYAIDIIAAATKILIDEEHPEKGSVKIRVGTL